MKKTDLACLTLVVLLCSVIMAGGVWCAPFTVAVEDDAAPWSKSDGTGFANDVVRASFKAAGAEVQLEVVPYARCKDMAIKGQVVACFSMSWLPEFAGKVVFADKPLFFCYSDYFTSLKRPMKASREGNIPKGTVLGIVNGYEYPLTVYELREKGVVSFEESESEETNLKKLAKERIDAALINYNETKPVELLMARAGVAGQVRRAFRSGIFSSNIGFSSKHPDGMAARDAFNRGYRIISKNGTRDKIERKWRDIALKEVKMLSSLQKKGVFE